MTKQLRKTAILNCKLEGMNIDRINIHWYRQQGSAIEWILYFASKSERRTADNFGNRFAASKSSQSSSCSLTITNIRETDGGTYFCAYYSTSLTVEESIISFRQKSLKRSCSCIIAHLRV
ncbi:HV205 protein, partial [Atractosteus spatula]|nr:HV205 protein [Atractosteus spatula]